MSSQIEKKRRGRPRKTKPVEEQLASLKSPSRVEQTCWQRLMAWLRT